MDDHHPPGRAGPGEGPWFSVVAADDEDGPLVRLVGELDLESCAGLARTLVERSAPAGRGVRVDVGELVFVDLRGLRELHAASHAVEARGGRLTLVRPRPFFLQVAELATPCLLPDGRGRAARALCPLGLGGAPTEP